MKVKEVTVKRLFIRIIVTNLVYCILLVIFMGLTLRANLRGTEGNPAALAAFLGMAVTFFASFYEMRLVRGDGKFFLPVARYLLFFGKPLMLVLCELAMIVFQNYPGLMLTAAVLTAALFAMILVLMKKYDGGEVVLIDYMLTNYVVTNKLKKLVVGVAVTGALFLGDMALLAVAIVRLTGDTSPQDVGLLTGALVVGAILVSSIVYYAVSIAQTRREESGMGKKRQK